MPSDWRQTRITPEQVQEWGCCDQDGRYSLDNLRKLCEGRPGLTPAEVLDLPIPWLDRLWVIARAMPESEARLLACDFAEHVLPIWESWAQEHAPKHLEAPRRAIRVARLYARGEATEDERREARITAAAAADAADAGYDAAAADDAYYYAYAAATTAAAAAYYAVAAAYYSAAYGAADAADYAASSNDSTAIDAEYAWQLARTREVCRSEEGT